ncbi:hypothetical protein Ssed_1051 [Shewanella sediminis HAW-EB3]|uniref:Uncharacterized protein n=1 Tax=Shewanella sediminis (strain HAW-EB3) TaxID=425104 RepID=A8FS39_SHESH|nr:hypothetical protein Ssed_1051 [Shewanella sediminis HAW-EB3]
MKRNIGKNVELLKDIGKVDSKINSVLIISLISIVLTDLVFNNLPELFSGASGLLNAYYNFCIGIVVSYIFYFFVVHLKEQSDKLNIQPYVLKKSQNIVANHDDVIGKLKKLSGDSSPEKFLTKNDIEAVFKSINPMATAPMTLGLGGAAANWLQYMDSRRYYTEEKIGKVFKLMPHLDTELAQILSAIEDCSYFVSLKHTANRELPNNKDLIPWAEPFYEYSQLCKSLEKYYEAL